MPFIVFRSEPSVTLNMINNQPFSGVFQISCPILEGDTVSSVAKRMARSERNIKDDKKIELWRFEDPLLGPRNMPTMKDPLEGKVQLKNGSNFHIDLATQKIYFDKVDLGEVIVYRILAE